MRLSALVGLMVAWATGAAGQAPAFTLRPSSVPNVPPVQSAVDVVGLLAGRPVNPFRYDCIANLEVVDAGGSVVPLSDLEPGQVRVIPNGQARNAAEPDEVLVRGGGRRLIVLLPLTGDVERVAVRLTDAARAGAPAASLPDLETEDLVIPPDTRGRCGSVPQFNLDVQDPSDGTAGVGLALDVIRRGPIARGRGGLWHVALDGGLATGGSSVLLDSWKLGGGFDLKLNRGAEHWVTLGGVARLEASEDLETIDRALGVALKARLDFLGIAELIRPLLDRFTPHPMLVVEYVNLSRLERGADVLGASADPAAHRVEGRLEWRVPLLFETTARVDLSGTLHLSDPPEGQDRWNPLTDVSLEYPVSAAGDVVAVLTYLSGRTAPLFEPVSQYLIGIGIRR